MNYLRLKEKRTSTADEPANRWESVTKTVTTSLKPAKRDDTVTAKNQGFRLSGYSDPSRCLSFPQANGKKLPPRRGKCRPNRLAKEVIDFLWQGTPIPGVLEPGPKEGDEKLI